MKQFNLDIASAPTSDGAAIPKIQMRMPTTKPGAVTASKPKIPKVGKTINSLTPEDKVKAMAEYKARRAQFLEVILDHFSNLKCTEKMAGETGIIVYCYEWSVCGIIHTQKVTRSAIEMATFRTGAARLAEHDMDILSRHIGHSLWKGVIKSEGRQDDVGSIFY